jgi:ketosteroid isomerase-like protein
MNRTCRLLIAALTWTTLLALSAPAQAHPDLDAGKRLARELELEPALSAFARAIGSGSLTRDELIELLAERALLLHALRRQEALTEDFVWLSALDPDHRLDLRAPPELTALWTSIRDQGRGALKVTLVAEANERSELAAKASLSGTVPDGARARIVLRKQDGNWRIVDGDEVSEALPQAGLQLYAEALGLGSVVIARDHSPDRPLRVSPSDAARAASSPTPLETPPSSESWARRYRSSLIGGAAVAVAIAIVAVVVAKRGIGGDKPETKPGDATILKPMISF